MDANPYSLAAREFSRLLAEVTPAAWSGPTPCADWDVRALVSHVVATHRRIHSMVAPDAPREVEADEDLLVAWRDATRAIEADLADPVTSQTAVAGRMGEQPYERLVARLLMVDTTCHAWDLARAVGADEHLDEGLVATAFDTLSAMGDAIRVPGGFAPAIEPAEDADLQTRFLNYAGRAV